MAGEIDAFVNSFTKKIQKELTDLTAELDYTTKVHAARASVAGLANDVKQQVEDEVADYLDIVT